MHIFALGSQLKRSQVSQQQAHHYCAGLPPHNTWPGFLVYEESSSGCKAIEVGQPVLPRGEKWPQAHSL